MKIIVGLGNPGSKYELTRHNIGFLAVDYIAQKWSIDHFTEKFHSHVYEYNFKDEKTLLVKPQTWMNLSGEAVGKFFNFYKLTPPDIVIIHDELDLPSFSFRIKTGGGNAGHNGLKSIDMHLGKENIGYHRIRIGIGKSTEDTISHVLEPFSKNDLKTIKVVLEKVFDAAELIINGEIKKAMNTYNRRSKPQ